MKKTFAVFNMCKERQSDYLNDYWVVGNWMFDFETKEEAEAFVVNYPYSKNIRLTILEVYLHLDY